MRDKEKRKGFLSIAENERNMAEQEQTLALKASSNYNKSQETKSTGTTGSNVRGAVKSTPASTSTTPDFMKTGKKNPKLWENTLLNTVKNGGITKEKPSSVNLPDLGKRSTDSVTGEDDFTAWIKDKNKTLSFVKDLPNRDERAFGAAIFGKEAEERAYNRSVVEEMQKIGLAPNKTQDQLFREGFYGIEEEPDYTAILKNAIKPTWSNTPQSPHMQEFVKKQSEANKSQEEFARISNPNVKFMPAPTGDYSKQWHAAPKPDAQAVHEENSAATVDMIRNTADAAKIIGYGEKPYQMFEEVNRQTAKIAGEYDEAIKVVDWLNDAAESPIIKSMRKVSTKSKAFAKVGTVLDVGVTYAERREAGYDSDEAVKRTVVNAGTKVAFSWACTKGGTALGAKIGTLIYPGLGTAIGAGIGFLGGMIVDFFWGDDIADEVEKNLFTTTPDEDKNLIFT